MLVLAILTPGYRMRDTCFQVDSYWATSSTGGHCYIIEDLCFTADGSTYSEYHVMACVN